MEHRVFGAPRPGAAYGMRPGAYGVAFDGRVRAAMVLVEQSIRILLGGGIEPGKNEEACIRREIMEAVGYSAILTEKACIGEEYTFTRRKKRPFHPIGTSIWWSLGKSRQRVSWGTIWPGPQRRTAGRRWR